MTTEITNYDSSDKGIKSLLMSEIKDDLTYADYVEMGRSLLRGIEVFQARIAFYACRVCQIRHGGHSNGYYTLTDYARDLGVPKNSLQGWTLTYRNVIMKLEIPLERVTKEVWRTANRVNDNISWKNRSDNRDNGTHRRALKYKPNLPAAEVRQMFVEESGDTPSVRTEVRSWMAYTRQMKNNLMKRDLNLVNDGDLFELMTTMLIMTKKIDDNLQERKKRNRS